MFRISLSVPPGPRLVVCSGLLCAALLFPCMTSAQLVREDGGPPVSNLSASSSQNAQPTPQPTAKSDAGTGTRRLSKDFTLQGDSLWTDTAIDVKAGERLVVSGTGTLRYTDAQTDTGPDGMTRGFKDLLRVLPVNSAGRGALVGRIGDENAAQPFLLGANKDVVSPIDGRLWIGLNQAKSDTGDGSYKIHVDIYAADSGTMRTIAKQVPSMPGIDASLFAKIPRRIGDKDGNPGDMVNFLIIGTEDGMRKTFTTAGWVKVDADVKSTILNGFLQSMSKESYLTMPMSPLYLFARTQHYGWAHPEPIRVVASRTHLRICNAPFPVYGQTVWVGAATHDVGFEKDQRNNGITHKIDPDIDAEREFVQKTLCATGLVSQLTFFLPDNPMREAKTATGGSFHSNGQVLVMLLDSAANTPTNTVNGR